MKKPTNFQDADEYAAASIEAGTWPQQTNLSHAYIAVTAERDRLRALNAELLAALEQLERWMTIHAEKLAAHTGRTYHAQRRVVRAAIAKAEQS